MAGAAVIVLLSVAAVQTAPQEDIPAVRDEARSAAFAYESLLRRRAPGTWGGSSGACDERIGRFCFQFDTGDTPEPHPTAEHPDVTAARIRAITAHRRWLSVEPGSQAAAGALIRYLVEAGRPSEAVSTGRTHAWATGRTAPSLLLLGLALHEDGRFLEAEAVFDSARAELPIGQRKRLDDLAPLLASSDRSVYQELTPGERENVERRFWRLSDPSLIDPGNERRSGHYARHAWARILSEAPRAQGMISWGEDHEEILLRYGRPVQRERVRQQPTSLENRLSIVESFDPHAVALAPEELLSSGFPSAPAPGVRHEMERDSSRSAYAPVERHRLRPMDVQLSRFPLPRPGAGALVRWDGVLHADTATPRGLLNPHAVLVVLDTLGAEILRSTATATQLADSSTLVSARAALPPGRFIYSLEVVDRDSTDHAGIARYPVTVRHPPPDGPLRLSDPVIAAPAGDSVMPASPRDPALRPLPDLVLPPEAPVVVFAEVSGLETVEGRSRYTVEWWLEPAEPPTPVIRAAQWLGQRLGLWQPDSPVRVLWDGAGRGDRATLSFVVLLADAEEGLQRLHLRVRDRVSGLAREATRLVRLDPRAAPAMLPPGT